MKNLPTQRKLLDWAAGLAHVYERMLDKQRDADPITRAIWQSRREAYLNVHLELVRQLPELIEEARLLPEDEDGIEAMFQRAVA